MMLLSEAASAINATLIGADVLFTQVSKDSRTIAKGALYVALKGENFDGHSFLDAASESGAVAAIVSDQQNCELPQLAVKDTKLALGQLAANWRARFAGIVIGVTGSNGKTTVKEMCHCILVKKYGEKKVISTQGNFNNDIGMPMSLLNIRQEHEVAVIEMGANHMGEIAYLTNIAKPDVAIITNVSAAHIEGFGSIGNIAQAKSEIFDGLSRDGVAIINADDDYFEYWKDKKEDRKIISFSIRASDADVVAKNISGSSFLLKTHKGEATVALKVAGRHNIMNALAATAASLVTDVSLDDIVMALESYTGIKGRLQFSETQCGSCVIDDTYNANPYSLGVAIEVLVAHGKEAWLVLGDMGELGGDAEKLHREAGVKAKESGVKRLFATGKDTRYTVEGFGDGAMFFASKTSLAASVADEMDEHVAILVKGSRHMKMEEVVYALMKTDENNAVKN